MNNRPFNTRKLSLIEVCEIVAEKENLRIAVYDAALIGSSALLGGILAGRIGLILGGTVGFLTSVVRNLRRYRSVVSILRNDLTVRQKCKLENSIRRIMKDVSAEDAAAFLILLSRSRNIKALVIRTIANFLLTEMGLNMIQ